MAALTVVDNPEAAATTAAERGATLIRHSIDARGGAVVCLTGGRAPRRLYELLADPRGIDWTRVHLFWGDERHVPPDHPESNFGKSRTCVDGLSSCSGPQAIGWSGSSIEPPLPCCRNRDTVASNASREGPMERRQVLRSLTLAGAALSVPGVFAQELIRTPAQGEGPFYPDKLPLDTDNDLLIINDG